MNAKQFEALRLHEAQRDAHATLVLAIKYPSLVSPAAVNQARASILAHAAVVFAQMQNPDFQED